MKAEALVCDEKQKFTVADVILPESPGGRHRGPRSPKVLMKYPGDIMMKLSGGPDCSGVRFIGEKTMRSFYQAYFKQDRDGAIRPAEMDTMAEVARFCRQRQAFCHRSAAVPQIALLYSTAGHYHTSRQLFHPSGSDGVDVLRKALNAMLGAQYAVQVVSEHHLATSLARWPLIVVPGWSYLEPAFCRELTAYAQAGGRLLLIGPGPAVCAAGVALLGGHPGGTPAHLTLARVSRGGHSRRLQTGG